MKQSGVSDDPLRYPSFLFFGHIIATRGGGDHILIESTTRVPPPIVQPSPAPRSSELPPSSSSRPSEIPPPPTSSSSELPKRNPHQPPIPYHSRLNKEKLQGKSDIQVHKFLQMFKKLHFNISLAEALALMPKYAKILKDLLSDKEKLLGLANTSMTENYSAVLLKKLPDKLEDPSENLYIPYVTFLKLGECTALADLGASINLMPLSIWKKLMLPELIPTRMTLELANRSVAYPAGIAEDRIDIDELSCRYQILRPYKTVLILLIPILVRFSVDTALVYYLQTGGEMTMIIFLTLIFPLLPTSDSTLPEESSEIATFLSSPLGNEDKDLVKPGEPLFGVGTQIFNDESKDKDLKVNTSSEALLFLEGRNFLSISSDQKLLFHLKLSVTETLLSFSSKNEDKVFNPGILISKGVHSLTLGLSHRTYETFKIVNVHPNILNESLIKIFPFFCFCPKDKGIRGESS
ncbi:reverse transcriptase domain-containing protein [Tanacetum coccineum]